MIPLAAVLVTVVGSAQAAPSTKFYSAAIAPTEAREGSVAQYALTLTNQENSTQSLGSADFSIPTTKGFTVTAPGEGQTITATSSHGQAWNVTNASGALRFRATSSSAALPPSQSVSALVDVATACGATDGTWKTTAKQANNFSGPPGNDFKLVGSDPTLTVVPARGEPQSLQFVQQPSQTEKGSAVSPAVTVKVVDKCGNQGGAGVTVSMGLQTYPEAAASAFSADSTTSAVSNANGIASFGNLKITASGTYKLVASSTGLTSATSGFFNVVDRICVDAQSCATGDVNADNASVHLQLPSGTGKIGVSLGAKRQMNGCGTNVEARGALVLFDPPSGYVDAANPIKVTIEVSKVEAPGTGVTNFKVCKTTSGDPTAAYQELSDCGRNPKRDIPCILSRNRTGAGDLKVVVGVLSGDPWGGIG
jgi:hypothetical protein